MQAVTLALVLLTLTVLSAVAVKLLRPVLRLPLPLVQIGVGTIAALPAAGLHVTFEPHTFLLLFIPPLLFADGWRMPRRELRALRWPLLGNAVVLVFATVLLGGIALHLLIPSMPLPVCFAVAAVVSPTDAVAFGAITESITVPSRIAHLLESEALLNDASGLVALRFAVAAAVTGSFSLLDAAGSFLLIALGGLAVGWALIMVYGWLTQRLDLTDGEAPVQAILSALLPFAAYWLAERIGCSGILAAVAAGITANHAGLMHHVNFRARIQSTGMWRMINYVFNGVIFVLLGSQLPSIAGPTAAGINLVGADRPWLLAGQVAGLMGILLAIRAVWVAGALLLEHLRGRRSALARWRTVAAATLGGVRGAITLAGVLTLPLTTGDGHPFPSRDLAITLATGVILLSLLLASVGLPLLLRGADSGSDAAGREGELRTARLAAVQAAIAAIAALPSPTGEADARRDGVLAQYRQRLTELQAWSQTDAESAETEDAAWRDLHARALAAERDAIWALRQDDRINDEVARDVVYELDLLEAATLRRPLRVTIAPAFGSPPA